jgi:hypothetical protein
MGYTLSRCVVRGLGAQRDHHPPNRKTWVFAIRMLAAVRSGGRIVGRPGARPLPTNTPPFPTIPLHQAQAASAAMTLPPNAWVSRATAKLLASWARPAEQPIPSQAHNAAAVASDATTNEGGPHFPRKKQ